MGYSKALDKTKDEGLFYDKLKYFTDIITSTMGPGGRSVLVQSGIGGFATWDGVTVAEHLVPRDALDNLITYLIVDGTRRTVKEAGDGTTTTAALLAAIYELYAHGYADKKLKKQSYLKGISNALRDCIAVMEKYSKPIVDDLGNINIKVLRHVSVIASNGNVEMGHMVADMIHSVGAKGRVLIKKNLGNATYVESENGYTFGTRILGREHLKEEDAEKVILENPYFIINADVLETVEEVEPIIDTWLHSPEMRTSDDVIRPLVIISTGLVGSARSLIAGNAKSYPIYVIQTPMGGGDKGFDILKDIQGLTGTNQVFIKSKGSGIRMAFGEQFRAEDEASEDSMFLEFGQAERCVLTSKQCSILPGRDEEGAPYDPTPRIKRLEMAIKNSKDEGEIDHLRQRIAALSSGVGVIYVGGDSDTEVTKLEASLDDTQRACFAAIAEGVLPGAGCAFENAASIVYGEYLDVFKEHVYEKTEPIPKQSWMQKIRCWFYGESMIDEPVAVELNTEESYWAGYHSLLWACYAPTAKIISNFKEEEFELPNPRGTFTLLPSVEYWEGVNATGNRVSSMYKEGIIDPLLVSKRALINAVSIAKELIDCQYVLIEDKGSSMVVNGGTLGDDELPKEVNKQDIRDFYAKLKLLSENVKR
ncbi:MAG: hypothetical protein K0U41_03080 [Gammaproteobacteria bacterium]|nr:hypothetical protein [Gammaproteobacteria bacterium]